MATSLDDASRIALQNIVRNTFRKNQHLVSVRHTKIAYTAGYHGLDILDASVDGDSSATSKILDYLSKTPAQLKEPPPPMKNHAQRKQERSEATGHDPTLLACPPPEQKMLNNWPRRELPPGKERKVPYFVQTNGFSFLRIKKPQPANLSRVLRDKIQQRAHRQARFDFLRYFYVPLAEYEDNWDMVLNRFCGLDRDDGVGRWAKEYQNQRNEVWTLMNESTEKSMELARRQWAIVEEERKLAEKEKMQEKDQTVEGM